MLRNGRARVRQAAVLLILVGEGACADATGTDPVEAVLHSAAIRPNLGAAVTKREREAVGMVARGLALAMGDPSVRRQVFDALASTANPESKIHFASFMRGRGATLIAEITRRGGGSASDVRAWMDEVRDLELYMPVRGHREQWTGATMPDVVMALEDESVPVAYDPSGGKRMLSRTNPPAQPVLVLAPLETDLRTQQTLNERGHAERNCEGRPQESLAAAVRRCAEGAILRDSVLHNVAGLDGVYLERLHFNNDECNAECWMWGDPEYEIHIRHPQSNGYYGGGSRQCTAASPFTFYQPGIKSAEYGWNMDGRSWEGRAKLLNGPQADSANNEGGFAIEIWEDDLDACRLVGEMQDGKSITALFLGGTLGLAGVVTQSRPMGLVGLGLWFLGLATVNINADDFVGLIVVPQNGQAPPWPGNMLIYREDGLKGWAKVAVYDATPPVPGPTASVSISASSGFLVPIGGMSLFTAIAVDASGLGAPERSATWSTSNGGIATVSASGWVTGHSQGSVTITATIDGVSNSVGIDVLPYGPVASVSVQPNEVSLSHGQQQQTLTLTMRDANGFDLPIGTGIVEWTSANSNVCDVGIGNVVYAMTSGTDWTTVTASVDGVSSPAIPCSVNGGNAYSVGSSPRRLARAKRR